MGYTLDSDFIYFSTLMLLVFSENFPTLCNCCSITYFLAIFNTYIDTYTFVYVHMNASNLNNFLKVPQVFKFPIKKIEYAKISNFLNRKYKFCKYIFFQLFL